MLFITGNFNGENCDLKPISATELLKAAGVEKWKKNFELNLHKSLISYDSINKVEKHRIQGVKKPYFTGVIDGNDVTITYGARKPREDKRTGKMTYFPKNVYFVGKSMRMDIEQDLDFCTFMFLHSENENSPIRKKNIKPEWTYEDKAATAKKETQAFSRKMALINEINSEKDALKLIRIATGIKFVTKADNGLRQTITIHGAKDMDIEEIRLKLAELAMKYPEFQNEYRSTATLMTGTIREAIDSGKIQLTGLGGGVRAYVWNGSGKEICRISRGDEPFLSLSNHLKNDTAMMDFLSKLGQFSDMDNSEKFVEMMEPEVSVEDMKPIALINKALNDNAIQRQGMQVVILNNWVPEERALHNISNSGDWVKELEEALNSVPAKLNRLRARLINGPTEEQSEKSENKSEKKTKEPEKASK